MQTLPANGGRVKLSREQAEAWLRSLNDVRLALGVRLGVTDDFDGLSEDVEADDPRFAYVQVYQWLAFLQEQPGGRPVLASGQGRWACGYYRRHADHSRATLSTR